MSKETTSKGHVRWVGQRELFRDDRGEWFWADVSDVIDVRTGFRIGRWRGPAAWDLATVLWYVGADDLVVVS